MKRVLLLSYFLVSISVFGQTIKLSPSDTSYFYEESIHLKSELPDGYYEVYYDEDKTQLKYEGEIQSEKKEGLWKKYNSDGTLVVEYHYSEGQFNGDFKEYYQNGQLKFQANFKDGFPEGKSSEWWENGVKKSEGLYIGGAKTGLWKFWDNVGELTEEATYGKGIMLE